MRWGREFSVLRLGEKRVVVSSVFSPYRKNLFDWVSEKDERGSMQGPKFEHFGAREILTPALCIKETRQLVEGKKGYRRLVREQKERGKCELLCIYSVFVTSLWIWQSENL